MTTNEPVNSQQPRHSYVRPPILIGIIANAETTLGFLMAGIGDRRAHNFKIVSKDTPLDEIVDFFTKLYQRKDMGIILIGTDVIEVLGASIAKERAIKPIPIIIEVPTRESLLQYGAAQEAEDGSEVPEKTFNSRE